MDSRRSLLLVIALAFCVVGAAGLLVSADSPERTQSSAIYVAANGDCGGFTPCYATIQDAVDAAIDGDLIKVAAGTYTDVFSHTAPSGYIGSEVITQHVYLDKSVAIRGGYATPGYADPPDPEANSVVLDAQSQGRVLFVAGYVSPTIEGLQFTGGHAAPLGGNVYNYQFILDAGGGVYVISATATISQSEIYANVAQAGGGIYVRAGSVKISNTLISDNQAVVEPVYGGNGAGVYVDTSKAHLTRNSIMHNTGNLEGAGLIARSSLVTLTENIIDSNSNTREFGGGGIKLYDSNGIAISNSLSYNYGGGISVVRGHPLIMNNTIMYNESGAQGAGVSCTRGSPTIKNNIIVGNYSHLPGFERLGGGLFINGSYASVQGNLIEGNVADKGGGIYSSGWSILDANIIRHNRALGSPYGSSAGGGIYLWLSHDTLTNNIVADNYVDELNGTGGGMYIAASSPQLLHNTVAGNNAEGIYVIDGSDVHSIVALANTILVRQPVGIIVTSGNTARLNATLWGSGSWANGDDWAGTGTIDIGVINIWQLPAFKDADGGDYHITTASAAMDAGIDAGIAADMDGHPRPMGTGYDIGADELLILTAAFAHSAPDWLGQTTVFTNTTVPSTMNSYVWAFGDGFITTLENPSHLYVDPGMYTVTLTATNQAATDAVSETVTVYGPPVAGYHAYPTEGIRPLNVIFTNTTTTLPAGDPSVAHLWQFGDGHTSTLTNATHTYTAQGVYTVTLTAVNPAGSDTETKIAYITVEEYEIYLPMVLRRAP